MTDRTNDLLVIKVSRDGPESYEKLLGDNIQGQPADFTVENISAISDEAYIRKTYKLPLATRPDEGHRNDCKELEYSILGLMALRGAT